MDSLIHAAMAIPGGLYLYRGDVDEFWICIGTEEEVLDLRDKQKKKMISRMRFVTPRGIIVSAFVQLRVEW